MRLGELVGGAGGGGGAGANAAATHASIREVHQMHLHLVMLIVAEMNLDDIYWGVGAHSSTTFVSASFINRTSTVW